ncbi:VIT1/CCC1 family predicted Fe2+/Mn2+ transporter [Kribbella steppae]|uniref:VIT1/CCC1 family predicted Fe2+/Mn2+ transporter n=1 Tax=Kribbella steppae TaxID=2512223 RepID=A0A4R2H957_9ACTN|nr:VIT1/CCC1 transporter family protein [Kribbella steppae]TCO23343.1 VIT1/CCC1 family predicted Fe2+/Mn2+ transporter [Kribbella steppae]
MTDDRTSASEGDSSGSPPEVSAEHHGDHTHRDVNGGWLRPAVFGAMDGLVSNFALIAGMDGGTESGSQFIVLAGLAGLAAGAFSMAAGEYTSVASQRELARAEIEVERKEIQRHPLDEEIELAETYRAKGLDPDLASKVAKQFHTDPDQALEEHVREELGIDPHDLPNPMLAAASSFICFAVGAFIPLLPYLLGAGNVVPALVLSLTALFVCGAVVSRVTTRSWWYSGLRQLILGGLAAALTYFVGTLVGPSI